MKKFHRVLAFLRSQSTMNLATVDTSQLPRSTPVFFVADEEMHLYWFSSARSRHSLQCVAHPRVSVSVYRHTDEWRRICGVQMDGLAIAVKDDATRRPVEASYIARFRLGRVPSVALKRSALFRFTPTRVRFLDNSRGLGYKFELEMEPHADRERSESLSLIL